MSATPDPIESMGAPALLAFGRTIPTDPVPVACGLRAIIDRRDTCHAVGLRVTRVMVAVPFDGPERPDFLSDLVDLGRRMLAQVEDCDDEIDAAGAW